MMTTPSIPWVVFCTALSCLTSTVFAFDINNESLTQTVRFQTTEVDFSNASSSLAPTNNVTALATYNGNTYFVWVDDDYYARITKITSSGSSTVRLDLDDDYHVQPDDHHTFSIGIDKYGYIHVVGDMHNFDPNRSTGYLSRFDNANVLYWVSDQPEDISSFTFQGDDPSRTVPGLAFSYCKFYSDRVGDLYLLSRTSLVPGFFNGNRSVSLHAYDAETRTWSARGDYAPASGISPWYPCILWEDNSHLGNGYQGFMATLYFDLYNRMHFGATIYNDNVTSGGTDLVYAYSDDGGITFNGADGNAISPLPMRAESGSSQADIAQHAPAGESFWNFAGVYADGKGQPSIATRWNGSGTTRVNSWVAGSQTWSTAYLSPVPASNTMVQHYSDASGVMTYFSDQAWGQITRSIDLSEGTKGFTLNKYLASADREALYAEGIFRMVSISQDKTTLAVVDLEFSNTGSYTREVWTNLAGGALEDLTSATGFPLSPDSTEIVDGPLQGPNDWGNSCGARLRGMLHPPASGDYTFWIAGNDACEFWLSSDASIGNSLRIAYADTPTNPLSWTQYPSQQSVTVNLQQGKRYYFEVLHKEATSADHLAVAWSGPTITGPTIIGAEYLSPWFGIPEGVHSIMKIDYTTNLALGGTALLGANTVDDGSLGTSLANGGSAGNIVDGSYSTRSDTWNSQKDENGRYYDFAGISWSSPQDGIAAVRLHHATFGDGGWFDYPRLGSSSTDDDGVSIEPRVQYTMDGGSSWQDVSSLSTDYSQVIHSASVPTGYATLQPAVTFTFAPVDGIDGIRVFGDGSGPAGANTAGFIGVYEFEVFARE